MKVGEYVRTKNFGGSIEKIIEIIPKERTVDGKERYLTDIASMFSVMIEEQDIIKSSPNIIDLIEVGDYVNGLRVEKNKYGELYTSYVYYGGDIGKQCEVYTTWLEEYKENEDWIESIVTKEQFETMEYKVEV